MRTKILQHLSLVLAALLFNACCHDDDPVKPASTRTVLVYIAGDNNLSDYINYNLEQMIEGAREGGLNQCDFLIYADRATATPALYQLKADETGRIDTVRIRDYAEHNSATPEVLRQVVEEAFTAFPSDHYGLVLWSHATAWLPNAGRDLTRSFGTDGDETIEIDEMADALAAYHFDYILFDACYMGAVEVAYELRERAAQIIASPTEVMGSGFPYTTITPMLCETNFDGTSVAQAFYDFYDAQSGYARSATVSVVDTKSLDQLAAACREVLAGKSEAEIFAVDPDALQPLEFLKSSGRHYLFDLGDYIQALATDEQYTNFRAALNQAIPYRATTPYAFFAAPYEAVKIERFSGLSVYLPGEGLATLNEWYKRLAWYQAVYL